MESRHIRETHLSSLSHALLRMTPQTRTALLTWRAAQLCKVRK